MAYDIVCYVTARGDVPVVEFLESLNVKEAAKCLKYMEVLAEEGNSLPASMVKHLEKGLWELRPEFGGTEFRFFYFIVVEDTIIMLHAVKKKSQKAPRKEIELALKRMEECKP